MTVSRQLGRGWPFWKRNGKRLQSGSGMHGEFSDAWHGMAEFARTEEFGKVGVTKTEYEEWGGERIRKWWGGNWNMAT